MKYILPLLLAMILSVSVQFAKSQAVGTGNTLNTTGTGITAIQSTTATSYKLVVGGAVKIFGPTTASTAGSLGSPSLVLGNNFTGTGKKYGLFSSDAGHFIIYDSVANLTRFVISNLGKIGIGLLGAASTPALPDSTLHVSGGFKLVNGTQGANKILVSDAAGGASWQIETGDITSTSNSGSMVTAIGANKVTYAKIQTASLAGRLLGSPSTGTAISELKLGTGLIIANDSLKLTSTGGTGTVTSVSVTAANGFSGTVATPATTAAISIGTSVTGLLKGNGTAVSAAVSGTDFSTGTNALATGIIKSTTTTGALSIAVAADFPILNQNTTGTAANVTGVVAIANGGTGQTTSSGSLNVLLPAQTGNANKVLQSDGTNAAWVAPTPALVSSVFGRTGAVVAAANDYTFAQLAAKPTTLAGYGITDAATLTHTHTFSTLTDFTIGTPLTGQVLTFNGTKWINLAPIGGGTGTVTAVSIIAANGLAGTVANPTTTPAITLTTSVTGIMKGNGNAIAPATAGTDFSAGTNALATGILKSTTATGALSIAVAGDFPVLNQNTTGTAGNVTGVVAIPNGGTGQITATGALNALLPLQTGNASKMLQTDGANATWVTPLANAVSSVFGRTGTVVAAANDYTFAQIASKPTTLAGYGITDAAALNHTHTFSTLTDFTVATPVTGQVLTYNGTKWVNLAPAGGTNGTVTSVSVVAANGFTGSVSNPTTTPAITISTSANGMIKGNGTSIAAATAGTDFSAGTSALSTGILKSTNATGALSIATSGDFPILNQNTTGTATNITGILNAASFPALTGDVTTTAATVATTIAANAVSFGKIQQVPTATLLGRSSALNGNVESITLGAGLSLSGGQLNVIGSGALGWNLNGNTVGALKTIGTIDNFDIPLITNNTEKMRLTTGGNLGIGTTTPQLKLHIAGQDGSPALMISKPGSDGLGNVYTGIEFGYLGGLAKIARIMAAEIGAGGGNMEFQTPTGGTANPYSTKLYIARDGNVGVATTNPTAKFHANGSVRFEGLTNDDAQTRVLVADPNGNLTYRNASTLAGTGTNLWAASGNNISNTNTANVGIGTSNPVAKLDVNGDLISRNRILAGTAFINADALQVMGNATIVGNITGLSRISNNNYSNFSYLDLPYFNTYGWTFYTPNAAANAGVKRFEVGNGADIVNSTFSNSNVLVANGNVGIGFATPAEKLEVNGNIYTNGKILIGQANNAASAPYALAVNGTAIFTKAVVKLNANWPDYVFQSSYNLPSLNELEAFLIKNKHLPDMPTAQETEKNGIDLGNNQTLLLKKVEELTLYMIELNKKIERLSKDNEALQKKIKQ